MATQNTTSASGHCGRVGDETVKNACRCTICGASADRLSHVYQCQRNPNHFADLNTGLFDDHAYPSR